MGEKGLTQREAWVQNSWTDRTKGITNTSIMQSSIKQAHPSIKTTLKEEGFKG